MVRFSRWTAALVVITATVAAGACDRVSDRQEGNRDARILVTTGYGGQIVHDGDAPSGGSVLDALRDTGLPVETDFGGGFVSAIGDVRADVDRQRDWFYYVNGVSPGRGADQQRVRDGDVLWWDHRPWGGLMDAWAVVGVWPEPFVNGHPDRPAFVAADPPLDVVLREAGATVRPAGETPWRVRIGSDATLRRRDPAWRQAMADPEAAGLSVRIAGGTISVVAPDGRTFRPVPGGRAVAVAVLTGATPEAGGVLMAVAGLDDDAANAAADRIAREPAVLRGRFAVVFDAGGEPLAASGREGP